ncbi:MAG: hypothetical protein IJ927_05365 [Eubacterium sp.]|nr:hypothetical protein [Eubacterium sp.]
MKKFKKHISAFLALALIASCSVLAFADQENDIEIPGDTQHEHYYQVESFEEGVVTFRCEDCDDSFTERFDEHINERGYELLDMNGDGIVNAKDFAYLIKNY